MFASATVHPRPTIRGASALVTVPSLADAIDVARRMVEPELAALLDQRKATADRLEAAIGTAIIGS